MPRPSRILMPSTRRTSVRRSTPRMLPARRNGYGGTRSIATMSLGRRADRRAGVRACIGGCASGCRRGHGAAAGRRDRWGDRRRDRRRPSCRRGGRDGRRRRRAGAPRARPARDGRARRGDDGRYRLRSCVADEAGGNGGRDHAARGAGHAEPRRAGRALPARVRCARQGRHHDPPVACTCIGIAGRGVVVPRAAQPCRRAGRHRRDDTRRAGRHTCALQRRQLRGAWQDRRARVAPAARRMVRRTCVRAARDGEHRVPATGVAVRTRGAHHRSRWPSAPGERSRSGRGRDGRRRRQCGPVRECGRSGALRAHAAERRRAGPGACAGAPQRRRARDAGHARRGRRPAYARLGGRAAACREPLPAAAGRRTATPRLHGHGAMDRSRDAPLCDRAHEPAVSRRNRHGDAIALSCSASYRARPRP